MVWELGVKEVWKVKKPLDRVIHTLAGWPLKISAKYHHIGGSWIYPMKDEKTGDDLVSIGFVIDLDYADATTSAHDLLQQFKTHPLVREILEGGERVSWGAKAIPAGGYWAMPKLTMPGAVIVGDAGGMVNLAALKGVHYAIKSGILAAEQIYRSLKAGNHDFSQYEEDVDESLIGRELYEQRNTRQPFQMGLIRGGPLVNLMIATKGRFPGGRWKLHRNDAQPMFIGKTKNGLSEARRQVHLRQALERLHLGQRHARRRAEPHPRGDERAARGGRDVAVDVPGRGVRDPGGRARGGQRGRDRQLHELHSVRGHHGQGRAAHHARGRRRPAVPEHLTPGYGAPRMPFRRALATAVAVLACLSLAPAAGAANPLKLVSRERLADRLYELTFTTPALSAPTKVRLLLPAGYDAKASRRYPVLLLLHGAGGSYSDWTTAGEARDITRYLPVIVVMPDGGRGGWYSDWYNGGAFGPPRWETYHLRQLVPWIESRYRAVGERRGRAVAGLSMGGFGTMSYASRHPDMFSSAAAFSGAVDANVPPGIGEPIVNATSSQDGGKPGDVIGTRAENEVRWRGHNPWDLASNLRGVDVTLRTGDGSPGGPYDTGTTPDVIEQIVHTENLSFHQRLGELASRTSSRTTDPGSTAGPTGAARCARRFRGSWPGSRSPARRAARSPIAPSSPRYSVWGFDVAVQRKALEFSSLRIAGGAGSRSPAAAAPRWPRRRSTGREPPTAWWPPRPSRAPAASTCGAPRPPPDPGAARPVERHPGAVHRGRPAHGRHPRLHHHGEDQALGVAGSPRWRARTLLRLGGVDTRLIRCASTGSYRTMHAGTAPFCRRRLGRRHSPMENIASRSCWENTSKATIVCVRSIPGRRPSAAGHHLGQLLLSRTRTIATKSHSPVTE